MVKQKGSTVKIPVIRGVIDRRMLINFRVDPDVLSHVLPFPFRPKVVNGHGVAGICLIRLKHIRPRFLPRFVGLSSENAAHRIAVEWDENGQTCEGVYVPRRDTSSWLNSLAGGRLFPGVHHHGRFQVREENGDYNVRFDGDDTHVAVNATISPTFPTTSTFGSLREASDFFEAGSLGYSATKKSGEFDALECRTFNWRVDPLDVTHVESSFIDNRALFPNGSVEFDCALLMRGIEHEWRGQPLMNAGRGTQAAREFSSRLSTGT